MFGGAQYGSKMNTRASTAAKGVKSVIGAIQDCIYPPFCLLCETYCSSEDEAGICSDCLSRVHYIHSPLCSKCGKPFGHEFEKNHLCGDCLSIKRYFSRARAVGLYNGTLRNAVHLLKYQLNQALATPLGILMSCSTKKVIGAFPFQVVVPVPLHPKRLRERGFNQALSLARFVSRFHSSPLDWNNLVRTRWTHTQVGLSIPKRKENVKGAFVVKKELHFQGKHILLVDDVYTSGSTVDECAKVLLGAGARTVQILTLARAA